MIYLKNLFLIQFLLISLLISTSSSGFVSPVCKNGYWTQCFDRDNPSVTGDYETLSKICSEYPGKACSRPTAIDVRAVSTGKDYRLYKQNVKVSPTFGFECVNKNQANGKQCLDYKVRFCCPSTWYHWGSWSSCSRTCGTGYQCRRRSCKGSKCTGSSLQTKSCTIQKSCTGSWSKWGSWSSCSRTCGIGYLRRSRSCSNSNCIGSSSETKFCYKSCTGSWYHWGSWSSCSRTCGTGYQCRRRSCKGSTCTGSSLQTKSCTIQKSCTILPPVCKNGYWTQCFDRDNPSVTGDHETLREICSEYPGKACSRPTAIDVRAVSTGKDYRLYKQNVKVSPTFGFQCLNKNQANGKQCLDYKVRFCCPKP